MTHVQDDDGLILSLFRGTEITSPQTTHIGFMQATEVQVDALYGRLGDLSDSVHGPALLFALDRRGAADRIRELLSQNDIVLLDRYVSSNAAYGSARLGGPDVANDFAGWVEELEIGRFDVPVPDLQILLDVPTAVAQARALHRAESGPHEILVIDEQHPRHAIAPVESRGFGTVLPVRGTTARTR